MMETMFVGGCLLELAVVAAQAETSPGAISRSDLYSAPLPIIGRIYELSELDNR